MTKDPRSIEAMEEALANPGFSMCFMGNGEGTVEYALKGKTIAIFDLRDCVRWKKHEEEKEK